MSSSLLLITSSQNILLWLWCSQRMSNPLLPVLQVCRFPTVHARRSSFLDKKRRRAGSRNHVPTRSINVERCLVTGDLATESPVHLCHVFHERYWSNHPMVSRLRKIRLLRLSWFQPIYQVITSWMGVGNEIWYNSDGSRFEHDIACVILSAIFLRSDSLQSVMIGAICLNLTGGL